MAWSASTLEVCRHFARVAQAVAQLHIIAVQGGSGHQVVELAERDLPPGFGEFLLADKDDHGQAGGDGDRLGFAQHAFRAPV